MPINWDDYLKAEPSSGGSKPSGVNWDSYVSPEPTNKPGFISDVKRGSGQVIEATGSTLRDLGATETGEAIENYGSGIVRRNPSQINSLSDVVDKPFTTAREAVGEVAPQVAGNVAAGLAGRVVGGALGLPFGPAGVAVGQNLGAAAGAYGFNLLQEYGGIRKEQRDQGIEDKTRAFGTATGAAALDTAFGTERVVGKFLKEGSDILARESGTKLLKHVGKQAGIGVLTETPTEMGQTALERYGAHKDLTSREAIEEYGLSGIKGGLGGGIIRGGMSAISGEREPNTPPPVTPPDPAPGNEVKQAMQSTAAGTTPVPGVTVAADQATAPAAEAPAGAAPAAPIVVGGTTDVAQAAQAAQAQDAVAEKALQQQAAREQVYEQFGIADPQDPTKGQFFGQKLFGPTVNQVADAVVATTQQMTPVQQELARAVTFANAETGNQLVKFSFNANDPGKSVAKAFEAVGKVLNKFQIGHVQTAEEAGQILNTLSENAKGKQLEELNAIHVALTGEDTKGFLEVQNATTAKGAKDGQLQVRQQNPSGVGTVREQGAAGSPAQGNPGDVQPGGVQPVGTGSQPEGSLGLQVGQLPGEGVRPGTGGVPDAVDGGLSQAPQVTPTQELANEQGQSTPAQAVGTGPAVEAAANEPNAPKPGDAGNRADVLQGGASAEETQEDVTDSVGTLLRNVLGMVFKSAKKVEFLATFVRKQNDVSYEELGKRLGLSKNTIKQYQKMLRVDEATGLPEFIAQNFDKFQQALKIQSELMGVDLAELKAALLGLSTQEDTAVAVAEENDLVNNGLVIQAPKERVDSEGKGTGKIDRTNVSDLNEEGNKAEALNNRYIQLMDELDQAESEGNDERAEQLREELAAVAVLAAEADKRARAQVKANAGNKGVQVDKESDNASEEQSAGTVDVGEQAGDGQAVGEGNPEPQRPAGKGKRQKAEPKQEAKPELKELKTDEQRAGEAWDAVAGEYPNAPKWADLTKAQRDTFIEYGEDNWTPDDVRGELVKLARTTQPKQTKVEYPPKPQAGAPAYLEPAQRAVVDFMNGELTKEQLLQRFADLNMTEAMIRSVTNRIDITKDEIDSVAALRSQQGTQQSRKQSEAETYTAEDLQDSLLDFIGRDSLGDVVNVVDELEDLRLAGEFADMTDAEYNKFLKDNEIDAGTQAFVSNATGRAYMLASNIEIGTARGVFMHEVGGHLGVQKQLPQELFKRLANQVVAWAKKDDGSVESELAQAAMARVVDAGQAASEGRYNELVAYFLEEAVNSGIDPTAYNNMSPGLREWLRSLWAAFKSALRKLRGVNIDKLTAQDVVDLAYGHAQLALASRYHGSHAKFRQFDVKYMGSGTGNQQYGWGHYFAQRRKTAEGYAVPEPGDAADARSHLYTVDLAIRDHEWLFWNKPISQQPRLVRKLAEKMGLRPTDDGGDLYMAIAERMFEEKYKRTPVGKEANKAYRMASEFLDSVGIKGLQYRDANDSTRQSNNLVVFNNNDVIRVQTESGLALDRQALEPEFKWEGVQQSRRLPPQIAKPVERTWKAMFKNVALPLMITEDVVKMASKYMKSAVDYLQAQYKRQATRLQIELQVERLLQRFDKLPKHVQKLANEFIYDSTMQQKWGYYPGEHRVGTTLFEVDPDFEARFDKLPAEAQALVRDVFEHGFQMLKLKQDAVDIAIDREFAAREAAAMGDQKELAEIAKEKATLKKRELALRNLQVDKPYAYLGRHGDYVVVAKSKEFIAAEEIAKGESARVVGNSVFGDPQQAKNWLQENVSNPEHYIVQFAETQGEADKIAAELVASGKYDVQPEDAGIKEANASYAGGDAFLAVKRLRNMLDRQGGEADPALEKMIGDLYLATVAEASARKSELQRKFVSGADKNMMRNLATAGRADAHFISTALHNDDVVDSLERMRNEARGNRRDAMPIYNELYARYSKGLDYKTPGPLIKGLTQLSTVYYLSTSPAFYLQQILQTSVLSLPFMSGRLGYFRSARAIQGAYKDMQKLVKGLGVNDHVDFDRAPSDVRGMLQSLVGMGKIDIGIDSDAKARSGEHTVMDRVMMKIQGVNTRIETINRATAAIAAYRGYLQKHGMDKTAEATRFAAEVVSNTHGSYDAFNTPRALNSDAGRVFLQFKRFQIIQLSMLAKLFHNAFKGASKEEKLVAWKSLGFMMSHMAVLGGALGVPFVSQMGNILLSAFGDDDEPKDLEQKLRELIGDKDLADLLLRGAPSAVGLESLGKKLAMENVASVLPFTDIDLSSRSGMEKVLVGLMGPTAGLGLKMADGFGLMRQGDYYKGLEQLLPTGVANAMKGARFASEGVTMRNGDTVLSPADMSMVDAAFQAIGLPTDTITDRQRLQRVVASTDQFYEDRAKEVKTDYARAFKKGDSGAMQDAREAWMELQDARSRNGYTRQPLSTLFRAPQEQGKRERQVSGGVEFNKNNRRFVESLNQ